MLLILAATAACGDGDGNDLRPRPLLEARSALGQDAGGEDRPAEGPGSKVEIRVGETSVLVEIADEPKERERGFMFRDSIPELEGMLFVYEVERTLSFWMKNTPASLDIAFISADGRIVDIQQMEANTEELHASRLPAMYALEMRIGWFADHGIEVGDRVEF